MYKQNMGLSPPVIAVLVVLVLVAGYVMCQQSQSSAEMLVGAVSADSYASGAELNAIVPLAEHLQTRGGAPA